MADKKATRPADWRQMSHDDRVNWLAKNDPTSQAYKDRVAAEETARTERTQLSRGAPAPGQTGARGTAPKSRTAIEPNDETGDELNDEEPPARVKSPGGQQGGSGYTAEVDDLHLTLAINGESVAMGDPREVLSALLRTLADALAPPRR